MQHDVINALVTLCSAQDYIAESSALSRSQEMPADMRLPFVGVRDGRMTFPTVERGGGRITEVGQVLLLLVVDAVERRVGDALVNAEQGGLALFERLFWTLEDNPLTGSALGQTALNQAVRHGGITEKPSSAVPVRIRDSQRPLLVIPGTYTYDRMRVRQN